MYKPKPRYKNEADLMSDYKALLRGLDEMNPKDPTVLESKTKPAAQPLVESAPEPKATVKAESAPLSKYSSSKGALNSFRVLAGLEERTIMPWDPGIMGTTKSVKMLEEQYGLDEDQGEHTPPVVRKRAEGGLGGLGNDNPKIKKDLGGYSPKAAHKAVAHSQRVMSNSHAVASYMHELPGHAQTSMKDKLAQHHQHAAYKLRGAADGADHETHVRLHALADKHEKYSKIYKSGSRPKLESIDESLELIDSLLDSFV